MLAALGRHPNRSAHIHFILSAPGYDTVITHIFEPTCPYLSEDAVFGVKESLIATFNRCDDPELKPQYGFDESFWLVDWDFTLSATQPRPQAQ